MGEEIGVQASPSGSNTALILSGQPRFAEIGFKFIRKFILDVNPKVDIFLTTWSDTPEDLQEFLRKSYHPCAFSVYSPLKDPPYRMDHFFWGLSAGLKLKRDYEQAHGFRYRYVIRGRYDMAPLDPIKIDDLNMEPGVIYYPDVIRNKQVPCDYWNIGHNCTVDALRHIYGCIPRYAQEGVFIPSGEEILKAFGAERRIKFSPLRLSTYLIRDPELKDRNFGYAYKSQ